MYITVKCFFFFFGAGKVPEVRLVQPRNFKRNGTWDFFFFFLLLPVHGNIEIPYLCWRRGGGNDIWLSCCSKTSRKIPGFRLGKKIKPA